MFKPCPNCANQTYKYGWSISEIVADGLGGAKDIKVNSIPALSTIKDIFLGGPRGFLREVVQGISSTPLLVCQRCRSNIIVCPECGVYSQVNKRPSPGEIVNCSSCKLGFCTCERSVEYDRLMNTDSNSSWLIKAAFGFGVAMLISYIIKHYL